MNGEAIILSKKNITGVKIRALRMKLGISQKQFAQTLNSNGLDITACTLCKIESGIRGVSDIELWHIAEVLNISINELFN